MTENCKRVYYKMSYYPPYKTSSNNIKIELDLTNCSTKTDLNNVTHVDTSSFASRTNLAALKTEVDKIEIDKLETTPVDLAKLTNAVENDSVKKTVYNTRVTSIEGQLAGITKNTIDKLSVHTIKMSLRKTKFGDKEVYKKKFYSSKQAISLDSIDLNKIVVSKKWKIIDTTYKYICGYLNNDTIQPLCVVLPQMDGYIKYFDDGGKNMSFVTDDEEIYEKYNKIWEAVRKLLKVDFTGCPVRDDKYLVAKLEIFDRINRTTFTNNAIPIERNHYICIPAIDIDSVLKIDKKSISSSSFRTM